MPPIVERSKLERRILALPLKPDLCTGLAFCFWIVFAGFERTRPAAADHIVRGD